MRVTAKTLIAVALLSVFSYTARATNVGGAILTDTTWTAANSPYIVTSAIVIGGNKTLTIDPGVVVKFNAGLGITVGSQAFQNGTLKAIGTPTQKILFTSNVAPSQPGQWKDIQFTARAVSGAVDANGQYVSGSILEHCIVEYGGSGTSGSGAITITQAAPVISFCEVRYNSRSGIYATNSTSTSPAPVPLRITNCFLHHNLLSTQSLNGGGAFIAVDGGLLFEGNTVASNSLINPGSHVASCLGAGAYVSSYGTNTSTTVRANQFTNNTGSSHWGAFGGGAYFQAGGGSLVLADNLFAGNTLLSPGQNEGAGLCIPQANATTNLITRNTISGNKASGSSGSGGGLAASFGAASLTFSNNTISDNTATSAGGGWYVGNIGNNNTVTISGNTIVNNAVLAAGSSDALGGGMYISGTVSSSSVTFSSNTLSRNEARGGVAGGVGRGGALYVGGTSVSVNLSGDQPTGTFNVFSNNTATLGNAIYHDRLFNKNGANDIRADYVCWGGLDPNSPDNPTLIYDFFDNPQKAFVVAFTHVANSTCAPAPTCGPGLLRDCNGNCAPISWIGDGYCDNGFYNYNGTPIHLNCPEFGNDGGDCFSPAPTIMNPPNHNQPVSPPVYNPPSSPEPTQNKLILVTHGWNTSQERYATFWAPLRNVIRARVSADWKVEAYEWTNASLTFWPDTALNRGVSLGKVLGQSIAQQDYEHVHLIGHSAGSGVIAAAARQIRMHSPSTIVHTTFLDAFPGLTPSLAELGSPAEAYGGYSDWADHYFSREVLPSALCGLVSTGFTTQLHLPLCFNLDVSRADPDYSALCLSSHSWPTCFFRFTVDGVGLNCGQSDGCCTPDGPTAPYGFPLGLEYIGGSALDWLSSLNAPNGYPRGQVRSLPGAGSAADAVIAETGGGPVYTVRNDPPINFASLPSVVSSPSTVTITPGGLALTTRPAGAPQPTSAWVNFQITTTQPINFVSFNLDFTSPVPASGLLTVHVNGTDCGFIDEPYAPGGFNPYDIPTPGELPAGQHIVSFRLDHYGTPTSSLTVTNLATGFGGFAPPPPCPGDANSDHLANGQDLSVLLSQFQESVTPGTGADFNSDGTVNGQDLSVLLSNFGSECVN